MQVLYLSPSVWVPFEVVLAEHDPFVLLLIPAPNAVQLPQAFALSRTVFEPGFLAGRVQHGLRRQAGGHWERAGPDPDGSRVT